MVVDAIYALPMSACRGRHCPVSSPSFPCRKMAERSCGGCIGWAASNTIHGHSVVADGGHRVARALPQERGEVHLRSGGGFHLLFSLEGEALEPSEQPRKQVMNGVSLLVGASVTDIGEVARTRASEQVLYSEWDQRVHLRGHGTETHVSTVTGLTVSWCSSWRALLLGSALLTLARGDCSMCRRRTSWKQYVLTADGSNTHPARSLLEGLAFTGMCLRVVWFGQ